MARSQEVAIPPLQSAVLGLRTSAQPFSENSGDAVPQKGSQDEVFSTRQAAAILKPVQFLCRAHKGQLAGSLVETCWRFPEHSPHFL